jgi:hypothetical protein
VEIRFQSQDLRRTCERRAAADKAWGPKLAALVRRRLDDLHASRHLQEFLALPHIRHSVIGRSVRVDVDGNWALLLEAPSDRPGNETAGRAVQAPITILGMEHGNTTRSR